MKRVLFILVTLLFVAGTTDVQAQWLKKLGQKAIDRAEDRAKKKVERKVDDAVDKTVDNAFEGAEDAVKGEGKDKDKESKTADATDKDEKKEKAQDDESAAEITSKASASKTADISWNKFDFIAKLLENFHLSGICSVVMRKYQK